MITGLILNTTLLPALLVVLNPPRPGARGRARAPWRRWTASCTSGAGWVLWAAAGCTVASIALLPLVRFDFNPFHLRNPRGEAMSTFADLTRDPSQTLNTIDVLHALRRRRRRSMAKRLSTLPQVQQAITLTSFRTRRPAGRSWR